MCYNEKEYMNKKGFPWVESSIFGKCKVISKQRVREELSGNECFCMCDNIPDSKYNFYVDTETFGYFACKKK